MGVYFLVNNGDIYNHALPKGQFNGINAIIPEPPTYIAKSYENAYESAFVAEGHKALNKYNEFPPASLGLGFINETFGYQELYGNVGVSYLSEDEEYYLGAGLGR